MAKKIFTTTFFLISFAFMVMIIYFLFFYDFGEGGNFFRQDKTGQQGPGQGNTLIELENRTAGNNDGSQIYNERGSDKVELDMERLASSFAERFGSYSNQSDFRNITDLKIFMTDKMKVWSSDHIQKLREGNKFNENYYGITTKAVSRKVIEHDEQLGKAMIIVSTRRAEATDRIENTTNVFSQDLTLTLLKVGADWKVDSAYWSE
jgi:hypothetical protein